MAGQQSESGFPLGAAAQTVGGVVVVLIVCFVGSALISLVSGPGGSTGTPPGGSTTQTPSNVGSIPPLPTSASAQVSQDKGLTEDKFGLSLQYKQGIAVRGVQNKVCCKYEYKNGEKVCVDEKWDDLCPLQQKYYDPSPMNYGLGPIALPKTFFEILVKQTIKNAQGVSVQTVYDQKASNEYTNPSNFFSKIAQRTTAGQTFNSDINVFGQQLTQFPFNNYPGENGPQTTFLGGFNGAGVNSALALQFLQTPAEAKDNVAKQNPFARNYDFDYNAFIAGQVKFSGGNAHNWCYPERDGGGSAVQYGLKGGENASSDSQVLASSNASDAPAQVARLSLPPEVKNEDSQGWIDWLTNWIVGSILSVFNTDPNQTTASSWEDLVPELYGNMYKPNEDNLIYVDFFTNESKGVICSNKCFKKSPQRIVKCICARKWGETCNADTGSRVGCKLDSSYILIDPLFGDTSDRGRPNYDIQRSSKTNYLLRTTPEDAKEIEEVQKTITSDDVRKHILKQPLEAKKKQALDERIAGDKLFGEIYVIFPVTVFWAVTPPSFYGCTYTTFDGKKILPGVMPISINWLVETIESLPPDDESLVLLNLLKNANASKDANGNVVVDSGFVRKAMQRLGFETYDNIGFDAATLTFQAPVISQGSFGSQYSKLVDQAERDCYNPATAGCHENPPF